VGEWGSGRALNRRGRTESGGLRKLAPFLLTRAAHTAAPFALLLGSAPRRQRVRDVRREPCLGWQGRTEKLLVTRVFSRQNDGSTV
jgi:broad specificity phosphatase PhoE